jgi:3-oxoacyl-(acyl-carrier-protein) synthase
MGYRISGLGALSALGESVGEHCDAIIAGKEAFRPLGELISCKAAEVPASWIPSRAALSHRKWSPASMAALHVARQAIAAAGWGAEELRDAVLLFGTSRGGLAGWLEPWPGRRGFPVMEVSNSMHGEGAAAVSIELGIGGAYQVISTGCSAGLDALGMAMMHVQCGMAQRALVVAVDLPLVAGLMDSYHAAGILSRNGMNDPYHPQTGGIFPAEAAAAMALELSDRSGRVELLGYRANSDAKDALALAPGTGQLVALLRQARQEWGDPVAICPHATGTASHARAEPSCLRDACEGLRPSLHLLKPYLGHGIGAGSLLETVILCDFMQRGQLPPNRASLHVPDGFVLPDQVTEVQGTVWKVAASLGGHNAVVALRR